MAFLREARRALEQAGFGVLVPPWWSRRPRPKLRVDQMEENEEGSGLFGLDGLCRYEWRWRSATCACRWPNCGSSPR